MYLVGLTGGIAAGKSTVAQTWSALGAIEVDADLLARQAVAPGSPGLRRVIEHFGESYLLPTGELDREKLGELIFSDEKARAELEAIVHPEVKGLAFEAFATMPKDSIVVYTVPLLVEADVQLPFDLIVTVEAPPEERMRRLVQGRAMTYFAAEARVKSQASSSERSARADLVLNSNQDLESFLAEAKATWSEIERRAREKTEKNG